MPDATPNLISASVAEPSLRNATGAEPQSRNAAVAEPQPQPTQSAPQTRLPAALRAIPTRQSPSAIVFALGMVPISVERANHSADLKAQTAVADADGVAIADLTSQIADLKSQVAVADVDDVVAISDTSSSDDKPLSRLVFPQAAVAE